MLEGIKLVTYALRGGDGTDWFTDATFYPQKFNETKWKQDDMKLHLKYVKYGHRKNLQNVG